MFVLGAVSTAAAIAGCITIARMPCWDATDGAMTLSFVWWQPISPPHALCTVQMMAVYVAEQPPLSVNVTQMTWVGPHNSIAAPIACVCNAAACEQAAATPPATIPICYMTWRGAAVRGDAGAAPGTRCENMGSGVQNMDGSCVGAITNVGLVGGVLGVVACTFFGVSLSICISSLPVGTRTSNNTRTDRQMDQDAVEMQERDHDSVEMSEGNHGSIETEEGDHDSVETEEGEGEGEGEPSKRVVT